MRRRIPSLVFVIGLAALAAGCAKGLATPGQDAQARLLEPVPGKAVIYLLRDFGAVYMRDVKVGLDGQLVGSTTRNTFYRWEVPPGLHTIVSYTTPPAVLTLKTAPGGVYYVWQDINVGQVREPSRLEVIDVTTARATMDQARLLSNAAPAPEKSAAQ
jgi:hypothetical protein